MWLLCFPLLAVTITHYVNFATAFCLFFRQIKNIGFGARAVTMTEKILPPRRNPLLTMAKYVSWISYITHWYIRIHWSNIITVLWMSDVCTDVYTGLTLLLCIVDVRCLYRRIYRSNIITVYCRCQMLEQTDIPV